MAEDMCEEAMKKIQRLQSSYEELLKPWRGCGEEEVWWKVEENEEDKHDKDRKKK